MTKLIKSKQIAAIPNNQELNRLIVNSNVTIEEVQNAVDHIADIYDRNVQFVPTAEAGDVTIDNENDFIANYAYGIGWVYGASTCERIGNPALHAILPVHNDLRACTTTFDATPINVTEDSQTINYGGKQVFKGWLNPTNWYEYEDGTSAKDDIEGNCDVWIHNTKFYFKSFVKVTKDDVNTEGNYNMMVISTRRYNSTWHRFKAGYTAFTKVFRSDGKNANSMTGGTQRARSYSSTKEALELSTGAMKATSMTVENLKTYLNQSDICRAAVNTARQNAHTCALNNGCHLLSFEEYQMIFYWLPAIEFCTFNIEANATPADSNTFFNTGDIIARDNVTASYGYPMWYLDYYIISNLNVATPNNWSSLPAGYTNALGSRTGWVKFLTANNTKLPAVRYRGFEIKRDIFLTAHGCYGINNDANTADIYVTKNRAKWDNNEHAGDNDFRLAGIQKGDGEIKEFSLNDYGDIVCTLIGTGKADRSRINNINTIYECLFGGNSANSSDGGPGKIETYYAANSNNSSAGFRTRFNDDEYTSIYN